MTPIRSLLTPRQVAKTTQRLAALRRCIAAAEAEAADLAELLDLRPAARGSWQSVRVRARERPAADR